MEFPRSPDDRRRPRTSHAVGKSAWVISPDTRQCAQEADASMARDDWKEAPPSPTSPARPAAESN